MKRRSVEVYCSGSWVGFHRWPNASGWSSFLSERHRHRFYWKAWFAVDHLDRQIEFCEMQHKITMLINAQSSAAEVESWSCEQWASFIMDEVGARCVEVSEDQENGAVVMQEWSQA